MRSVVAARESCYFVGLIRRPVVDSHGLGHSPEKRKVEYSKKYTDEDGLTRDV